MAVGFSSSWSEERTLDQGLCRSPFSSDNGQSREVLGGAFGGHSGTLSTDG